MLPEIKLKREPNQKPVRMKSLEKPLPPPTPENSHPTSASTDKTPTPAREEAPKAVFPKAKINKNEQFMKTT